MFTEEQEKVIEDIYLSLVNDRDQYLKYKNWFSPNRLKFPKERLVILFKRDTYSFRYRLNREYGDNSVTLNMYQEIAERVYYHLFGKKLFEENIEIPKCTYNLTEEEKNRVLKVYGGIIEDEKVLDLIKIKFNKNQGYNSLKVFSEISYSTYNIRKKFGLYGSAVKSGQAELLIEMLKEYIKKQSEPTDKEISEFTNNFTQELRDASKLVRYAANYGASPETINRILNKQEKEMSIEQKNAGVPVANVTLVFGKDIKSADDNSLIDLLAVIDSKGKAIDHLDKKSKYYQSKIKELNNARSEIQDELDSRV